MTPNRYKLIAGAAAIAFVIAVPAVLAAQNRPNSARRTTPLGPTSDSVLDMRDRDMNIRRLEIEKEKTNKPTLEVSRETIKQVNEDFARIQGINAEIMRDYVSGKAPDYKLLSEEMADIKKRAERLNTNLLLPPADSDVTAAATGSGLKKGPDRSPLLDLNDLIHDFVTNPIFKNANTIDVTLGAKAKHDLLSIVELSERIGKSAEKLSKAANRPR